MKILLITLLVFCIPTLYAETSIGDEFFTKAISYREAGETLKSLDAFNQAIVAYEKERNYEAIFCAINGQLISWKHLFYQTEDPTFALFVQKLAETLKEFTHLHQLGNRKHIIHYQLATAAHLQNNYPEAEVAYHKAIELYPEDNAEKADWTAHLGDAMIYNGKKEEGKQVVLKGINAIQEKGKTLDSFLLHTWLSGAYLRLAKALQSERPQESQQYLQKAKEIIDQDNRLIIRKQQMEKIEATICPIQEPSS